jgi:SAM-dependent methyltransferase
MKQEPYESLAAVYDKWTAANDYPAWCAYLKTRLADATTVLDVCCGTGTMTRLLQEGGYVVTGVDRSEAMLRRARAVLDPATVLVRQDLSVPAAVTNTFDAVVCCFDSVNYFVTDAALDQLFRYVSASLCPGGMFVFDVNTKRKLESLFGDTHYGDDLGDFAYVWRNRYDAASRQIRFLITLFTKDGDGFARHEEHHVQRWFTEDELNAAAVAHGFSVQEVTEDYTDRSADGDSLRETWVLRRR